MVGTRARLRSSVALVLFLGGCGTTLSFLGEGRLQDDKWRWHEPTSPVVDGVVLDVETLHWVFAGDSFGHSLFLAFGLGLLAVPILILDLPVSLAFDVALLPADLVAWPIDALRSRHQDEESSSPEERAAPVETTAHDGNVVETTAHEGNALVATAPGGNAVETTADEGNLVQPGEILQFHDDPGGIPPYDEVDTIMSVTSTDVVFSCAVLGQTSEKTFPRKPPSFDSDPDFLKCGSETLTVSGIEIPCGIYERPSRGGVREWRPRKRIPAFFSVKRVYADGDVAQQLTSIVGAP